jgi:4-hydroxy-tetrahydrodipicolinate synthase
MIALVRSGEIDRAERIDEELRPLYEALSVTTNPIPLKAALNLLGHDVGGLRLPLVDADEAEVATVQAALAVSGLLPTATA